MIKSTTKKKVKKASSKKANPGKDWIRHADLRPKGGGRNSDEHKYSDEKSNQEYYTKLHKLAEDIQWKKRDEYPIHGYPWHRALEDASELLAKKKANPKKCRTIKVRRKISMGKGKRPRILQVRRKVCNPSWKNKTEYISNKAYRDGYDLGFDEGECRGKNPYDRGSQKWKSFMSGLSDGINDGGWGYVNDGS